MTDDLNSELNEFNNVSQVYYIIIIKTVYVYPIGRYINTLLNAPMTLYDEKYQKVCVSRIKI